MTDTKAMAIIPYNDIEKMATAVAKSKLFGIQTPEQGIALMLIAQAEGLHPAIAARDYHIIQGRPSLKADAMLARFLLGGGKVEWHTHTDAQVAATFSHPQGGTLKVDWTMERAKAAGLIGKDNWNKYPRQMLRARVISEGVRAVFPVANSGLYTPEEVQDFEEPKKPGVVDRTPPEQPKPAEAPPVEQNPKEPEVLTPEEAAAVFGEGTTTGEPTAEEPPAPSEEGCRIEGDSAVGYVTAITQKPTATGGTKYTITLGDKERFGTFDKSNADLAKMAREDGKSVRVKFKKSQYGKDIERLIISL